MLFMQARNSAAATRAAINLRFENIDLMGRLRVETEKAQAAHLKAEQANLAKSKFLAAASHDLRQPMHAQGLFLEALARSGLSASQDAILSSVRAASEASAGMLNTLLDFSRIEAGVVEPQIRPFHLQPLLTRIENELAPQANAKGLVYRSRETHAAVESDPALVELILRNLILNAIRYTGQGGVLVACRARGEQTLLEVWDTGIGIEPSQQQEIFHEFHQLGNPERDRNKGLGLGLAIAQGLARTMGHELSLASTPGHGSVFRLSLPIARAAVVSDDLETAHSHARELNLRVLVIDDDEVVRAGMVQLLRGWGCACVAVESIAEAQAAARAYRPDMVISDYRLREQRTGAEAIAALRAEFGADLPALLITGDTAPERLREARASGVPLLHKPVSPSLLYRRLESMLSA
jgi:CheY-like chemotaxis protein